MGGGQVAWTLMVCSGGIVSVVEGKTTHQEEGRDARGVARGEDAHV